jgi:structural maintenance of chromosome 1
MRNQRAGQATFIPLDTIQVKPINDKFRAFAKGARLAVDVIQYEPAMERAIHHACGNSLVCDTMEVARYVCYEKGQEVKGAHAVLPLSPRSVCFTRTGGLTLRL